MPAFLVSALILVEADDEVQASQKALTKILVEPIIAFEVQSDSDHCARVVIDDMTRQEVMRRAGLIGENKGD